MWRKIQMSRSQKWWSTQNDGNAHQNTRLMGLVWPRKWAKVTKIDLTKTNARVTPTLGETVALVAKLGEATRFAQNASLLFSLCLKAFGNSFVWWQHTLFLYFFFSFPLFIFCFLTMQVWHFLFGIAFHGSLLLSFAHPRTHAPSHGRDTLCNASQR